MGQSSCLELGLSQSQADVFKLSVSAACRRMTPDQILDLADHLHEIIRSRSSRHACHNVAIYETKGRSAARLNAARRVAP